MLISRDLQDVYPGVFASALIVTSIGGARLPAGAELLRMAAAEARSRLDTDKIADHPAVAVWRAAYSTAGVKPSRYRSSVEALARRALKGDLPSIHPLVDIYNAVSLRHLIPLGAADADLVCAQDIQLRLARPDRDRFDPLGGAAGEFPLLPTVPVYAVGDDVLSWCFNCRDAAPTSLTPQTRNAIFVTEGVDPLQRATSMFALRDLGELLESAGARVQLAHFVSGAT